MFIELHPESPIPLYAQIVQHLRALIERGMLPPGAKLPSIRELAKSLGVNRTTVCNAYDELIAEGYARARVGQGTFVLLPSQRSVRPSPLEKAKGGPPSPPIAWPGLFSKMAQGLALDESLVRPTSSTVHWVPDDSRVLSTEEVIPFNVPLADPDLIPMEGFRKVLKAFLRSHGEGVLQYHHPQGYFPLRRSLARYAAHLGIEAAEQEILIVNGTQEAMSLLADVLLDPGDTVLVENPTYPGAVKAFRFRLAQCLGVPLDGEGIRIEALESLARRHRPKLLFTIPTFQVPTGITMSRERRENLLAFATEHQIPIVEDEYLHELRYGGSPLPPLKALDRQGMVVYIGTFSKVLAPGLRLGWMVAPSPLFERLLQAKQVRDIHSEMLAQVLVHEFCEGGYREKHIRRLKRIYKERHDAMIAALSASFPEEVTWVTPHGGFSVWMTLPPFMDAEGLLDIARQYGVTFSLGRPYHVDGGGANTLRLSFSQLKPDQIQEGVKRLSRAFAEYREIFRKKQTFLHREAYVPFA